ncbi:kyphoscoliosis peptidase-like isoform X2 [Anolis carolinensis]|uniref:kyphoscoliosis peptidase-like isoform X2 n=1 Tax=Anolis carolinensis TaxID=28377 RepID=UPI002F2B85BF
MAVCSGYARLFEKMCSIAGIRCKTITGTFERHTWNAVYIDGKWHLLDCTFGSGFVDDGKFTFRYDELYFLTHPDLFEQDHTPDCFILKIFVKLGLHILALSSEINQLHRTDHVVQMPYHHLPKRLLYSQFKNGKQNVDE